MATFTVNGQSVTVEKNQKLIRFLRDTLHLTSVKDGCSEGACGTCHVLIDGKPTKACIPQTDKLEGKTILTVEGLSDWEKQVYTFAFGEAGAVQCGFCIPGMVISAKALLDENPDPTREEAAFAIRNNICRCTGYVKIIDGILLAGKIFREGKLPQPTADDWQMGSRVHRLDVAEKVLGYGQYPDDVYVDGMCYGSAVRSQCGGVRQEAVSGFPTARHMRGILESAGPLSALVWAMSRLDDSTLVYRGGPQGLAYVQQAASALLALPENALAPALEALDDDLIARHLSPGGSADLLALALFLRAAAPETWL